MRDPRRRNIKAHMTAQASTKPIEWASEKQEAVFWSGPYPTCASGGFGASKTFAMCLKILWLLDTFPNNRVVVARRIWAELQRTTLPTFFKICPPQAYEKPGKRSDSEKILRLRNGSELLWLHLDDPDVEGVIRGLEINSFFIDQAEEIDEQIFDLMSSRLGRWDKAEIPEHVEKAYCVHGSLFHCAERAEWPWKNNQGGNIVPTYALLACNPGAYDHWIYRRFHPDSPDHHDKRFPDPDSGELKSYADLGYQMFEMNSLDNKYLTKQNRAHLLSKDETFRRRFVEGKWGIPEGQIHNVLDASLIPGNPSLVEWLKRTCKLHRGMDHGDAAPTACLWTAVDTEGNIFVYREYYRPNALISEHRSAIGALSKGEHYGTQIADPAIFYKLSEKYGTKWSVANEYADVRGGRDNAIHWQRGDNDEMGTRNRISELLRLVGDGRLNAEGKDAPRVHPLASFDARYQKKGYFPRVFFVMKADEYPNGCDHVVRELRGQRRKRIGTENGRPIFSDEREDSVTDHAYDAFRYLVAARISSATAAAAPLVAGTWDAVWKDHIHREESGHYKRLARLAERRGVA